MELTSYYGAELEDPTTPKGISTTHNIISGKRPSSYNLTLTYQVIGNYGSLSLKEKKLKIDSYELGSIRKYINDGDNLNGAHDIMMDTKAQTNTIINKIFIPFINCSSLV